MTRALIRRVLCAALAAVVGFLCASCSGTTVVDTPSASATLPPASPRYAAPSGDGDMTYVASLPLYLPSRDGKRLIARLADVPLDRSEPAARAVVQALLTAPADDNVLSLGRGEVSLQGVYFNPNIPTEECFISPKRGIAEGIVYATKPLSYQGQLIEGFSIRFENGKAVEVHAEKNEELLKKMISMDEGAAYLGECALVPVNSPISESGLLFYETLFDENAACHLALGMGFADSIKDFDKYTLDECREKGINDSMIHVDFMIGFDGLDIDAVTRDGKTVPIFRKGTWAF